jgi:hypothetical protein
MRCSRGLGLCFLAAFALAAVTAGAASAEEPALYQCGAAAKNATTKKYEGRYEKGCETENAKHEGKYEFEEWRLGSKTTGGKKGKVKKFKSKGTPASILEIPHVSTVECAHTSDEGEFTGPKTAGNIKVTFTGCKASSIPCENGASGEMKTNLLEGEIGYISKTAHIVGMDLKAQSGEVMLELHCGSPPEPILRVLITGSVIGSIEPLNVFTKELTIDFAENRGHPVIPLLEGMSEPDVPLAEYCKSKEVCEPEGPMEGGLGTGVTLKTEDLYLKA